MRNITRNIAALILSLTFMSFSSSALAEKEKRTLNMKNADIKALISQVADITGYNFIVDPRVKGKVSVISSKPMDADELYNVFLAILSVHRYTAVKQDNLVHITPQAEAKQSPIPVDTGEGDGVNNGEELVTRVLQVTNTTAHQLIPILRPLIPRYGHLAAYPPTNVIIITDRANNIKRLVKVIKRIDKASDEQTEIIPLKYASAKDIVRIIRDINRSSGSFSRSRSGPSIQMVADDRTNSIILKGDQSSRKRSRFLVAQLDKEQKTSGNTNVVYLRYAKATELSDILDRMGSQIANEADDLGPGFNSKNILIQADETTNSLVITAPQDIQRTLSRVIEKLDIRRAQVLVDAIIVEVNANANNALGIQWGYVSKNMLSAFSFNNIGSNFLSATMDNLADDPHVRMNGLLGANANTLNIGRHHGGGRGWQGLIQFLNSDIDANILSTPSLMTLDNVQAEIVVGQNVPFIVSEEQRESGNPFVSVKREDVANRLKITPHINEGGAITLEIEQEVSSIGQPPAGIVVSDVVTDKRKINTTVLVDDQETVVLGGLINETDTENIQKVPLLGSIPFIGHLFKSSNVTRRKDNLVVFIRPTVLRDAETTHSVSQKRYDYMRHKQKKFMDDGVEFFSDKKTPMLPTYDTEFVLPPSYEDIYGKQTLELLDDEEGDRG